MKARERERERKRDCMVLAHESFVLAWFLRISKHNVWIKQSILLQLLPMRTHARIQKVLSEGVQLCNSDNDFLFFKGREDPNITKSGPSPARQRNAINSGWRADDGPTLNAGLVALRILRISGDPIQYC